MRRIWNVAMLWSLGLCIVACCRNVWRVLRIGWLLMVSTGRSRSDRGRLHRGAGLLRVGMRVRAWRVGMGLVLMMDLLLMRRVVRMRMVRLTERRVIMLLWIQVIGRRRRVVELRLVWIRILLVRVIVVRRRIS